MIKLSNIGAIVPLEVLRNAPWAYTFTLKDNGVAVNISGRTFAAQVKTSTGTLAATATCAIVNAAAGTFSVSLSAAATAALTAGTAYVWSLEMTASGTVSELMRGDVEVVDEVTT